MVNENSTDDGNVETITVDFPLIFRKLNLGPFGRVNIEEVIRQQGNKVVLMSSDSAHMDGEYHLAIVRDTGDRTHYFAALLKNHGVPIRERRFPYSDLAGLIIGEGETAFQREFKVVRYGS